MKNSYDQSCIETDCEREEGHADLRTKNLHAKNRTRIWKDE